MIELLIFHLHIVAALYAFTKNWQMRAVWDGILSILIIGLLFSIGWALTGTLSHKIMPDDWVSPFFTKDTLSLVLLLVPEFFFFKYFIMRDKN